MSAFIRDLPLVAFLIFFVAFPLLAAAVCLVAAFHARRQVAALQSTPVSNIGMASDGYCKFAGTGEAIGGHVLSSPLTQSACIWYRARVERWTRSTGQDDHGNWSTVRDEESMTPFFLRDSTGVCLVDPSGAELTPSDKSQWYGSTPIPSDRNPPRLGPTESSQPVWEGNQRYRYYEERVYADSNLTVAGQFTNGRFTSSSDFEEEDDADDADSNTGDHDTDGHWVLLDKLHAIARETTRARIGRSTGKPFIITTHLEGAHVAMSEMGMQAAQAVAAGLMGLAALMLYARFG
jgi:hypothetical protein